MEKKKGQNLSSPSVVSGLSLLRSIQQRRDTNSKLTTRNNQYQDDQDDENDAQYNEENSDDDSNNYRENNHKKHIDISKFLPPANPLIPKIYNEDYEVLTVTSVKFTQLPNFNKTKAYNFPEPSQKQFQLQEYMARNAHQQIPINGKSQHISQQSLEKKDTTTTDRVSSNLNLESIDNKTQSQGQTNTVSNQPRDSIKPQDYREDQLFQPSQNLETQRQIQGTSHISEGQATKTDMQQVSSVTSIGLSTTTVVPQNHRNPSISCQGTISGNNKQNPSITAMQPTPQQSQITKMKTLLEYHKENKDKLVYKKYADIDLNEPTQINGVVYFSTYIANFKANRKSRKGAKRAGQEQKKPVPNGNTANEQLLQSQTGTAIADNSTIVTQQQKEFSSNNQLDQQQQPQQQDQSLQQSLPQDNNSLTKDLIFSSNFESGNLFCAYRKDNEGEYDLVLQNDINTKGNTQWFFFSVSNVKSGQVLKFNILNCIKSGSLFNDGLCPAVYSVKSNALKGQEWIRDGFNISYLRNNISRDCNKNKPHYTLSFQFYVTHTGDTLYFAHSYPYSYSDLKEYINNVMSDPAKNQQDKKGEIF